MASTGDFRLRGDFDKRTPLMSTFDALCEILVKDYALDADSLTPDTTLAGLAIDSLGVIELIFAIEDRFKVSFPDVDATTVGESGTLSELSHYVDQLIATRDALADAEPAGGRTATPP
jgi:acyl carrier protein